MDIYAALDAPEEVAYYDVLHPLVNTYSEIIYPRGMPIALASNLHMHTEWSLFEMGEFINGAFSGLDYSSLFRYDQTLKFTGYVRKNKRSAFLSLYAISSQGMSLHDHLVVICMGNGIPAGVVHNAVVDTFVEGEYLRGPIDGLVCPNQEHPGEVLAEHWANFRRSFVMSPLAKQRLIQQTQVMHFYN